MNTATITVLAGAGGAESCDWASMLFRMYQRWVERHGYASEIVEYLDGDEAGIKSATFTVSAPYPCGYLKNEHGIHRLVRISPFDAAMRRHTSFATVEVRDEQDGYGMRKPVRSYILHPYQAVKDYRTGIETGDVNAVLDGDIDLFFECGC